MFFITSPLEQFQILPLIPFFFASLDFSITNSTIIILIGLFFITMVLSSLLLKDNSFYILPSRWQFFFEDIYKIVSRMLFENIGEEKGQFFFVYVFTLFLFLLTSNLIGLVPYSFTITSHLIVTFSIAIFSFIGINIICVNYHGVNILSLFFPAGSSLVLALLLIPIEIVSYIFRPISLSVRLFANMMAGHTLLKVIAGFS
jgi:F-type H+-transporting ATPase subunit a